MAEILPPLAVEGAGEDGEVGVAGEIAGAADAVHHGFAHDVSGIHVAAEVDFDGGIHGNDAETAHDFRVIGDLLRPHEDAFFEEIRCCW